jgi:hypothetical protein
MPQKAGTLAFEGRGWSLGGPQYGFWTTSRGDKDLGNHGSAPYFKAPNNGLVRRCFRPYNLENGVRANELGGFGSAFVPQQFGK